MRYASIWNYFLFRVIKHCTIIQCMKKKIKVDHDNHYHKLNLNHNHSRNDRNHKIWHLLILFELFCRVKIICASVQELCKNSVNILFIFLFFIIFFSRLTLWMVLLSIPMKAKAHQIWVFKQEISSRCLMPGRYRTNRFFNEFFSASAFVVGS